MVTTHTQWCSKSWVEVSVLPSVSDYLEGTEDDYSYISQPSLSLLKLQSFVQKKSVSRSPECDKDRRGMSWALPEATSEP